MRVCLDTNVLVAAFATRGLCADVFRNVVTKHDLVLGEIMLDELAKALRTKFRLPRERIDEVFSVLRGYDVLPRPVEPSAIPLRDPSDRWILATAVLGAADVLVTGDRDLIAVQDAARPLSILTPREFWELLRSREGT